MSGESTSLSALSEERFRLEREAFELEKARLEAARIRAETELKAARSGHPFLVFSSVALLALAAFAGGTVLGLSMAESRHRHDRENRLREALSQIDGIASGAEVSTNSVGRTVVSGQSGEKPRHNVAVVVIQ